MFDTSNRQNIFVYFCAAYIIFIVPLLKIGVIQPFITNGTICIARMVFLKFFIETPPYNAFPNRIGANMLLFCGCISCIIIYAYTAYWLPFLVKGTFRASTARDMMVGLLYEYSMLSAYQFYWSTTIYILHARIVITIAVYSFSTNNKFFSRKSFGHNCSC